jgi:Tol biopolymer transport system component
MVVPTATALVPAPAEASAIPASTPAPAATPEPTPEPLNLAFPLKLVRVADGLIVVLPLPDHDAVWSPDSTRLAYASEERGELIILDVDDLTTTVIAIPWIQEAIWMSPLQLAVATTGRIVFIGLDGEERASIAAARAYDLAWSSEARALLYRQQTRLHVWVPDGRFTLDAGEQGFWLDDGRLAVVERDGAEASRVLIYDPYGAGDRPREPAQAVAETRVPAEPAAVGISPDGSYAAYRVWSGTGYGDVTTYIRDIATGREVARFEATNTNWVLRPTQWDPAGERVLVQPNPCTPEGTLATAGIDGNVQALDRTFAYAYSWSPDGGQIAYSKGTDLWVAASDGGGTPRRLIEGDVHGTVPPRWSPDGRWIAVWTFFGGFGACE